MNNYSFNSRERWAVRVLGLLVLLLGILTCIWFMRQPAPPPHAARVQRPAASGDGQNEILKFPGADANMLHGKNKWPYLNERSFSWMRQITVLGLLRNYHIRSVLEIGCYITPVCRVAMDEDIDYVLVEPFAEELPCQRAQLVKAEVHKREHYSKLFLQLPQPRAIVALGMDYPHSSDISFAAMEASLVVLEAPHTYTNATDKMQEAAASCMQRNKSLKVIADFEMNDRTAPEKHYPGKKHLHTRRMVVLADRDIRII